jgi:hypothetical protein
MAGREKEIILFIIMKHELHNEELRDLYSSPSIITIIKSRRMRWAGHVARMGEKRKAYRGKETTRKTKT